MLDKLPTIAVAAFIALGVWIVGSKMLSSDAGFTTVEVTVPALSNKASAGAQVFATNCAACHGDNASGSDKGPPLIHDIYNPGHHADGAVLLAVKNGVRAHHWPFGNMPPQPQVSAVQAESVITYIREVQAANGIESRPHQM